MGTSDESGEEAAGVSGTVLEIADLCGGFVSPDKEYLPVLDGVSFTVRRGTLTAVVGETGSGKTLTMLSVVGLAPRGFTRTGGRIVFEGSALAEGDERSFSAIRGSGIAMVFQNSRSALNPVFTVGTQLGDVCRLHHRVTRKQAARLAEEMLARVCVSEPRARLQQYPHQLSGGTAQRVQLALALACEPTLLILDEPTTGLDVTIQLDILELIVRLNRELAMTTCMITHDLGVVADTCDEMVVMRRGEVCERGRCEDVMTRPTHPYTTELLTASRIGTAVR